MHRILWTGVFVAAVAAALAAQVPASKHVYLVAEENHSYESIVGSSNMPYLNSLIEKGALATQFYADQHSSLPDYFWLTAGQAITENNETTATYDVDNLVRHILQLGLSYRAYAESLPYPGFTGLYSPPTPYLKRHVPLPYFSDMGNSPTQLQNLVSTAQMDADIKNGEEPNFAFITPDASDDIHNCPTTLAACEQRADTWLKTHIAPLLARPEFQPGGDGLLIVWTDEADLGTDNRCSATVTSGCGGRVVVTMYGPQVKQGYRSTVTYHHESLLRTMLMAMGTNANFPGASNAAVPMSDMFAPRPTVISVAAPLNGSTVLSPMQVSASASGPKPIVAMQVYVDNKLMQTVNANAVRAEIPLSTGPHYVVLQSWDSSGSYTKQPVNVTIAAPKPSIINVQSPLNNATVSTTMNVVASAAGPNRIVALQVYVDNVLKATVQSNTVNVNIPVTPGSHNVVLQSWDNQGKYFKQPLNVTAVQPQGITILAPAPGATVGSPVNVVARASAENPIVDTRIYVDNNAVYNSSSANVNTDLVLGAGSHYLVVQNWDSTGKVTKATEMVTVK